jgi:acyl-CoA thioesterase-1
VVVALGDSITQGVDGGGTPWPARLAALDGKTVINAGIEGTESSDGVARIQDLLLEYQPGYITILYGANDVIMGADQSFTIGNLTAMIQMARANKTVPILATLTPSYGEHAIWDSTIQRLNDAIRTLASNENVTLVDLAAEFGNNPDLFISDGLHPNDQGNQIIALAFNDAIPH